MASTYSTLGRLEIMTAGEKDAVWGDITNSNLQLIEQMVHGYESIDLSLGPTYSLTTAQGSSDQGRKKILKFTGAQAAVTVTVPAVSHVYLIWNATNFDVVVRTIAGSGPTVPAQTKTILFCDGSAVNTLSGLSTTPFTISLLDDPDAAAARQTLGVPGFADDSSKNIFTAQDPMQFRWNDSGAGFGPNVVLARDSATPAANDTCGALTFRGRNTNAVMTTVGQLIMQLLDPIAGSEDARLSLKTMVAGAFDDRVFIGAGLYTRNVADKGIDTVNALNYYRNGTLLPQLQTAESGELASTANTTISFAHGLTGVPKLYMGIARCKTAEFGYAIGDEVIICSHISNTGASIVADATNISAVISTGGIVVVRKDTRGTIGITEVNWRVVLRAWAWA